MCLSVETLIAAKKMYYMDFIDKKMPNFVTIVPPGDKESHNYALNTILVSVIV